MKKIIFSTLFTILLTTHLISDDSNLTNMSEAELMQELMKVDKEVEEEKAKTVALKKKSEDIRKLGRTVDKLEQTVSER